LPNGSVRLKDAGNIADIEGYSEGQWWVQDASSAMAVTLLGDVKGKRVLDMCAAPGGKTAQLCDMGAIVTAADDSQRRLTRLRENMTRLGFAPEIICADGRKMEGEYDAILLDAPCTATGTISKNPEILNSRTIDDVKEMVKLQRELIDNAHKMLKSGGVLVYATCSLQYEEGEGLVKKLDATQWKLEEQKRILPTEFLEFGGTSGFYCARLVRV
jgi:16S rRNA (cytosine967-C5)-methyltransferase